MNVVLNMLLRSLLPFCWLLITVSACTGQTPDLGSLRLPDGFEVSTFASDLTEARAMQYAPDGTIYVSTKHHGSVYAIVNDDPDTRADRSYTLASGLTLSHGIALRNGSLYVSDGPRILRYDDIGNHLDNPPEPAVVVDDLPSDRTHGWRYMDFGPDDRLYVSIGAPCNVCERDLPYASIISMAADGTDRRVVARGIRNSVGFDWDPIDQSLWFTDNGRDRLGDDLPSDELNRVEKEGQHYGWPYVHQGDALDPEFGEGHSPDDYVAPVHKFGAHVAALGMLFYTGDMFPERYRNQIFVAEHGSWNRSSKVGYRVVVVFRDESGRVIGEEPFLEGFLQGEEAWGRPAQLLQLPDGSLLVSDDKVGAVYRITYSAR